jgi:hypothetical protein
MMLMRIFSRLTPEKRNDLLAVAETLAERDRVWPDTAPIGAYETRLTEFDPNS